jgi:hypothetical protein
MAEAVDGLTIVARVIKGAAIVVGGVCTFVAFASLIGVVTGSGWARFVGALVLTGLFPAFAIDRALPKGDATKGRVGLVVNVVALVLLGIAMLFVGIGQPVTGPLMVKEGDRLAEEGHSVSSHLVYLLAGVRPVDGPEGPTAPYGSASASAASASASASSAPSGAPGASAHGGQ